jgi:DNA-binding transcriptional ArsR family regulator
MQIDASRMAEKSKEAEEFLKKMANQNRLMILCVLSEGEQSVGELNERVPLSQSALSQHLSLLRDAGLVATRRESQTIYYRVSDVRVEMVLKNLYDMFCAE